jgi:hypothetical protein
MDQLRDELAIRDNDGQYMVNRGAGGQTLELTGVVGEASTDSAESDSRISVTYDSENESFTIVFSDFTYTTGIDYNGTHNIKKIVGQTFKFEAADVDIKFFILLSNGVYKIKSMGGTAYNNDSATVENQLGESSPLPGGFFQTIELDDSGEYVIEYNESYPVRAFGTGSVRQPYFSYNSGTNTLSLLYTTSPHNSTATGYVTLTKNLGTLPVTDTVIIGKDNTGNQTLDLLTNSGDYDRYHQIGYIWVDADGNVKKNSMELTSHLPIMGVSTTHVFGEYRTNSAPFPDESRTTTMVIQNGIIVSLTSTDWTSV